MMNLPYFDILIREIEKGNPFIEKFFGRHVHWGYWKDPKTADVSVGGFARAAESLTEVLCEAGQIQNGQRILDAGCGFGGTIASLNERFSNMDLIGLNIDNRQLERARKKVLPRLDNRIHFEAGDACALPFEEDSFDRVLAVECIFHFPDRLTFFQEARRVLRDGGILTLCDFVVVHPSRWGKTTSRLGEFIFEPFYGKTTRCSVADYVEIAKKTGLHLIEKRDITAGTMPTYSALRSLRRQTNCFPMIAGISTLLIQWAHRFGQVKYLILVYQKGGSVRVNCGI